MVFLNGKFLAQKNAKISTLDRGFLFGDGIYEVIPVYATKIFQLTKHLKRLNNSLDNIKINNPYNNQEYKQIFDKLIKKNSAKNQLIYLQISRGAGLIRSYKFNNFTPTIYIRIDELKIRKKRDLIQGFNAIIAPDIRWKNCYIKSTSLLANVLYINQAQENAVEEIILRRNNIITEGASSNVFMLKNNIVYTPKLSNNILAGITRDMVIKSCKMAGIKVKKINITQKKLLAADEVWISSSTREVMPITKINNTIFKNSSKIWQQVYANFQTLK